MVTTCQQRFTEDGVNGTSFPLSAPGRHRSGDSHPAVQLPFLHPQVMEQLNPGPGILQFSSNMPAHTKKNDSRQVALGDDIRPLFRSSFVLYILIYNLRH